MAPPKQPKVFDIGDLEFGFVVWLVACLISTIVFILEILIRYLIIKLRRGARNYIGLYLFWKLLRGRSKSYL
jgi:hypothetical protein